MRLRYLAAPCVLLLGLTLPVFVRATESTSPVPASAHAADDKPPRPLDIGDEGYDHEATGEIRRFRLERPGLGWGRNVATLYLDVTGYTTKPGPVPVTGGNARVIEVATMSPKLRKALGLAENARFVAAVTRANEGSLRDDPGKHSEPILVAVAKELLRELGVSGNIRARLKQRARAVVSERSWCTDCSRILGRDATSARQIYLERYVRNIPNKNANALATMWGRSEAVARDRAAMEAERERAEQARRGAFSPGPSPAAACGDGGQATGSGGPVDLQLVCGHTESPSGLTRALAAAGRGGIDFTSLELSYLSDVPDGPAHAVSYAFAANRGGREGDPVAGVRAVRQASDAFFVWLALPAADFWVNLNPNEPHRIIEKAFGRTDAGRVLLDADLQLKKSVAHFTDPRNPTGEKFWESLVGQQKCVSMRQWIVPGRAVVHATDEELHIIEAPLRLKMETSYIDDQGTGQYRSCPQESPEAEAHNERVYRTQVLPLVQRRVNHGPEYAALRRVYRSRVAAEWVRERHGYQQTAYDAVIGSGRVGRWAAESRWRPIDTFRAYVRSYRGHEYELVDQVATGSTVHTVTYVFGGVDFASVPMRRLAGAAFDRDYPGLAEAVAAAGSRPTREPDSRRLLLGGTTRVVDPGGADPDGAGGGDGPVNWRVLVVVLVMTALLGFWALVAALRWFRAQVNGLWRRR